ncbi:MAG: hypothetical protein JRG94_17350 [Deltaproteobacteria bacterium]|nr:hypothetical protein [Deltaproteobacteria bacterium]MBW2725256.1 hypothetical protein [Deltaproteobacteria bacterium]
MSCRPGFFRPILSSLSSVLLICFAVACEPSTEPASPEVAAEPLQISGRYELAGVTTTPGSDQARKISGVMLIKQEGDHYSASFEFKTNFPGEGPPVDADVIGVGEGQVNGAVLLGTARTQIVVSSVPGVDTGFAFIPRMVSTRIVSTSIGEFGPGGTLSLEIQSEAAEGEDYVSTHTKMSGQRVEDSGPSFPGHNEKAQGESAGD